MRSRIVSRQQRNTTIRRYVAVGTTLVVGVLTSLVAVLVTPPGATPAYAATPPSPPAAINPAPYLLPVTTPGPTTIPSGTDITTPTVWGPSGSPYIVQGLTDVDAPLTLLPGTVVKFAGGAYTEMRVYSQLFALGTPSQHVTFTSIKDDAIDGDTNGDGTASTPAPGDWYGISADLTGSVYADYVDTRYGGSASGSCTPQMGEFEAYNSGRLVVSNTHFSYSASAGVVTGEDTNGYAGVFSSTFDHMPCGGVTVNSGAVIEGNTFAASITSHAWLAQSASHFAFHSNTAYADLFVYLSGADVDTTYNSLFAGVDLGVTGLQAGPYPGEWFGYNLYTTPPPTCVSDLTSYIPAMDTNYDFTNCPVSAPIIGSYDPLYLPALSSPPQPIPQSVYDAETARYGPVDTSGGWLNYQASDMTVQDAGATLTADRTYDSQHTTDGDAGPGWSTSYSEGLSTFQGTSTLSLDDGSTLPFATDPQAGYTPAAGVDATYATSATGSTITTADQTTYQFDASGQLTGMLLGDPGHQVTIARSGGLVSKVTGVSGRYLSYTRTGTHVTKITDSQARSVTLGYTSNKLTSILGVDGKTTTYAYDSGGRLNKVTAPSGKVLLAATYDAGGRVASVTPAGQGTSTFTYNTGSTTITNADSGQVVQTYDSHGRLVQQHTVGGNDDYVIYDGYGRQIAHVDGVPTTAMTGYGPSSQGSLIDGHGDVVIALDGAGRATVTTYDSAHRPLTTTYQDGGVVQRVYDTNGRLTSVTDQLGKVWTYTYNARGQVLTQKNPVNRTRTLTYATNGNLSTVTDEQGHKTTYAYDALGQPTSRTDPGTNKWLIAYTTWGAISQLTTPGGNVSKRTYDSDRNLLTTVDGAGGTTTYGYDSGDRLTTTQDPMLQTATTTYDAVGRPSRITDVRGGVTKLTYSPDGYVTSSTDPDLALTQISNDPGGHPIRVTDAGGAVTQYTYDGGGQATRVQHPDGSSEQQTLDPVGRVASYTDGDTNTWSYTYDLDGHLTMTTDPLSKTTVETYDAIGRPATITDQNTHKTTVTYTDSTSTVKVADSIGTKSITVYDSRGNLSTTTDADGNVTTYTFNPDDLETAVKDAAGDTTTYGYDAAGRRTGVTDPKGRVTSELLDADGRPYRVTDPALNYTAYTYEPGGRVKTITDRTGGVTTNTYDAAGLLKSTQDALLKTTNYTYNALDEMTKVVDPTGVEEDIAYTAMRQPAVISDANGTAQVDTYDADGNVTTVVDPAGITTGYTYDMRDELTATVLGTYQYGPTWTNTYDGDGNMLTSDRPGQSAVTYTYDARNRVTQVKDEAAKTTKYTYDGNGNTLTTITPATETTTWTYDAANRMKTATDPLGNVTGYAYDPASELTTLTLPRGGTYQYAYDALGDIQQQTDPDTGITQYSYDHEGRPTETRTPAGRVIDTGYNADGEMTSSAAAGVTRAYGYDADGRLNLTKINGATDSSATYNSLGLMATETNNLGVTTFGYDAAHRLSKVTPPSGTPTVYTYGPSDPFGSADQGKLTEVSGPLDVQYSYDEDGALSYRDYNSSGGARTDAYTLGPNDRVASRTESGVGTTSVTYTADGQVATVTDPGSKVTTYGYDTAGDLKTDSVVHGSTTLQAETYGYDADGDRSSVQYGTATPVTSTYDPADRLQSSSDGKTYHTDADGNTTSMVVGSTTTTYGFNGFGEMSSYAQGTNPAVTYTNDAYGRTETRTVGSTTQSFGYTGSSVTPSGVSTNGGADTWLVAGAGGETVAEATVGGTVQRPSTDMHGNVNLWQNNATGATTASTTFDPEGLQNGATGSLPPVDLGFQGSVTDPTSGLIDMGARDYDPATGRFDEADNLSGAFGAPISANRYIYGDNDPVDAYDPDGHWPGWLDSAIDDIGDWFDSVGSTIKSWGSDISSTASSWSASAGKAWHGAESWAAQHKDGILEFAVSTVTFAGCEGAVGLLTGGVGAVAGVEECGALAGAAGGLTGQALKCHEHASPDACDPQQFVQQGLLGGVTGFVGGAAGGVGSEFVDSMLGSFGPETLGTLGRIGVRMISGAVSGAVGGGASGAAGYGLTCGNQCTGSGLWSAIKSGAGTGALIGGGAGAVGGLRTARNDTTDPTTTGDDGNTGCMNSFDPSTLVLMADGSTKKIKDLTVGDQVAATDPADGKVTRQTVTDLHIDQDTDLTDLTVAGTPGGRAPPTDAVVHTTQHHPFWDETAKAWVDAGSLIVGHRLLTAGGQHEYVVAVRDFTASRSMLNLTVDTLHTFYVVAGGTPILVHNCPPAGGTGASDGAEPLPDDGNTFANPRLWHLGCDGCDTTAQDPLPADALVPNSDNLEPNGDYNYVVMPDRSVRVVRPGAWPDLNIGHASLSGDQPVIMAGELKVGEDGNIYEYTNFSGHYWPLYYPGNTALVDIASDALTRGGFDLSQAVWNPWIAPSLR